MQANVFGSDDDTVVCACEAGVSQLAQVNMSDGMLTTAGQVPRSRRRSRPRTGRSCLAKAREMGSMQRGRVAGGPYMLSWIAVMP